MCDLYVDMRSSNDAGLATPVSMMYCIKLNYCTFLVPLK